MPSDFQYDVFSSHSTKDKAVVRPLAERFRQDGLKVWFDEWVLKPGDSIPARIDPPPLRSYGGTGERLERSRVLPLTSRMGEGARRAVECGMSANAFGSDWAQLACRAAAARRRRKAGTCGRDNLPFRDPLNSAFAKRLRTDMQKRRCIPLRLDDAPMKGALLRFHCDNFYKHSLRRQRQIFRNCKELGTPSSCYE